MLSNVSKQQVQALIGQTVEVKMKDGSVVTGKLEKLNGDKLYVRVQEQAGKAGTRAFILPLALFSVLAIGLAPFGAYGGGFGGPYGPGPGPYGPYGPGPGGPGGPYGPYGPGCCPPVGPKGFY
ncbi:hypothetical protein ACTHPH_16700 [Paenibacillus pasadenensis]|uniref:Uncharacterized protein n=1 Tax=Paenibacillus pasadenensis TaxID=217090 RepID=A0A2N5N3U8_9BACL|nr:MULTISPECIES: hypothetical protein [Paenibacillus]PLT45016.1 hypothetical protein B8V81_3447 [Paenibacillus pasadenensis]QGG55438.1 hypothetical protein GE073_07590 [Paenibacillus sp. B01]